MAKWCVLKSSGGQPLEAGYVTFNPTGGQTVDEYDDPQSDVMTSIKDYHVSRDVKLSAMLNIDASAENDANLKKVIEFLQDRYG